MKYFRFILLPFAMLYGGITGFRNWLFDQNIKREFKFNLPIINIGNLSVGGTGKTPHTEYLVKLLKDTHHLATLSRGYGRKVYGFQIADEKSNANSIGDEPMQFHHKFGEEITVAVDADRVNGVTELCYQKEKLNLVLLDDAYQHRHIKPGFNILLTDYSRPFYKDFMLPVGTLRELSSGKNRADCIVVTKCPDFNSIDKTEIQSQIKPLDHQSVFFSKIIYGEIEALTKISKLEKTGENLIVVTGIAHALPFLAHIEAEHTVLHHFNYSDHYSFKEKDIDEIHNLLIKFADVNAKILTTEKDAMRLMENRFKHIIKDKPWFYQPIEVKIDDDKKFKELILNYVQENRRDY